MDDVDGTYFSTNDKENDKVALAKPRTKAVPEHEVQDLLMFDYAYS